MATNLLNTLLKAGVIFHSTNERSHWTKDNISKPNLNNSILSKRASYCDCYCSAANGIFRSESRALLEGSDGVCQHT